MTPLDIFSPERSDRPERLFNFIKPYLTATSSILDVGCGNAPLGGFIRKHFPEAAYFGFDAWREELMPTKKKHKYLQFKLVTYRPGNVDFIKQKYDVVIHIGIDSWEVSPLHHFHADLLTKADRRPDYALLETGFADDRRGHYEAYCKAITAYVVHGYKIIDAGKFQFDVDDHHLKTRTWSLLEKQDQQ